MKGDSTNWINGLNEIIKNKQKKIEVCEQELNNSDYNYTVRKALLHHKLELQDDFERYKTMFSNALKDSKGVS